MTPLTFGNAPVPYTVLWSAEDQCFIGPCEYTGRDSAVCNPSAQGEGKPIFGRPHMQRQREVITRGLCDLCGRGLDKRTKVSLSHASERIGADGICVMQVEPLVHKDCAAICMRHCPSLRRDLRNGSLQVRLVTRFRVQVAVLTGEATMEFCNEYVPGAVGHAKVELLQWKDKDEKWLI